MIPKKIHYCWFGGADKPKSVKKCISRRKSIFLISSTSVSKYIPPFFDKNIDFL